MYILRFWLQTYRLFCICRDLFLYQLFLSLCCRIYVFCPFKFLIMSKCQLFFAKTSDTNLICCPFAIYPDKIVLTPMLDCWSCFASSSIASKLLFRAWSCLSKQIKLFYVTVFALTSCKKYPLKATALSLVNQVCRFTDSSVLYQRTDLSQRIGNYFCAWLAYDFIFWVEVTQ